MMTKYTKERICDNCDSVDVLTLRCGAAGTSTRLCEGELTPHYHVCCNVCGHEKLIEAEPT